MATDYDAPRKTDEEMSEDSLEELKSRRADQNSGKVDEDEVEAAETFELPGADLSHDELTVRLLPGEGPRPTGRGEERTVLLRGLRLTQVSLLRSLPGPAWL
mgnify:CR=1 FL=1